MKVVSPSAPAQRWADDVGIDFHEVRIETNAHAITLIVSDLEVSDAAAGYSPFLVAPERQ